MGDKTKHLDVHLNPTLLDHHDPRARWWDQVAQKLLPRLEWKLEQRFGNRHGLSPEQAVSSAVRALLEPRAKDLRFESIEDLRRWLYTVAWRKVKDALDKEHLELRVSPDEEFPIYEEAVTSGCEEAYELFIAFRASLDVREQLVLDGKLAEKTAEDIANQNGWTKTGVETIWKRIRRRAERRSKVGRKQ
jgi:DNA-directed RNA polymerase specialized sigma24 family protein